MSVRAPYLWGDSRPAAAPRARARVRRRVGARGVGGCGDGARQRQGQVAGEERQEAGGQAESGSQLNDQKKALKFVAQVREWVSRPCGQTRARVRARTRAHRTGQGERHSCPVATGCTYDSRLPSTLPPATSRGRFPKLAPTIPTTAPRSMCRPLHPTPPRARAAHAHMPHHSRPLRTRSPLRAAGTRSMQGSNAAGQDNARTLG